MEELLAISSNSSSSSTAADAVADDISALPSLPSATILPSRTIIKTTSVIDEITTAIDEAGAVIDEAKLSVHSTIDELYESFCKYALKDLSDKTIKHFNQRHSKHVSPKIGNLPIGSLTEAQYSEFIRSVKASPNYVSRLSKFLHNMFEYARLLTLRVDNPCYKINHRIQPAFTRKIYTDDDMTKIIKATAQTPLANFYCLAICTGLREGELLGLTRDKVLDNCRQLCVDQYLTGNLRKHEYELHRNMTRYSVPRTISLPEPAQECLKRQLKQLSDWEESLGWTPADNLLFDDPSASHLTGGFIHTNNQAVRSMTGIKDFSINLIRENYCINALKRNLNQKAIQDYMGYIASHQLSLMWLTITGGEQQEIAESMDDAFLSNLSSDENHNHHSGELSLLEDEDLEEEE